MADIMEDVILYISGWKTSKLTYVMYFYFTKCQTC